MSQKKVVSITLDPEVHKHAQVEATARGVSLSAYVEGAISPRAAKPLDRPAVDESYLSFLDRRISELHKTKKFPGRLARTQADLEWHGRNHAPAA